MSATGRFFWGPHAVNRAIERLWPRLTYEAALARLVEAAETASELREWRVRKGDRRVVEWRASNRHGRFRFLVAVEHAGGLPPVVTVLGPHDGWRSPRC